MLLGLARSWPSRLIGLVLAFGAGALVSAVSFELFEEGIKVGGATAVGIGLAAGALAYFVLARLVERIGTGGGLGRRHGARARRVPRRDPRADRARDRARRRPGVSVGLMARDLRLEPARGDRLGHGHARGRNAARARSGCSGSRSPASARSPRRSATSSQTHTGGHFQALINGFAAGALLVMLVDSMIPEATEKSGRVAGLATTLGFAVAAGLSTRLRNSQTAIQDPRRYSLADVCSPSGNLSRSIRGKEERTMRGFRHIV